MLQDVHYVHVVFFIFGCIQEFFARCIHKIPSPVAVCSQQSEHNIVPHSGMGCVGDFTPLEYQFLGFFDVKTLKVLLEIFRIHLRNLSPLYGFPVFLQFFFLLIGVALLARVNHESQECNVAGQTGQISDNCQARIQDFLKGGGGVMATRGGG